MIQSSPEELLQLIGLQAVELAQLRARVAELEQALAQAAKADTT
jgi:hypothetical protein